MTVPLLTFDDRAGGVKVDLDQLIVSRLLIQANSGGGKSHAIRYICEQLFGRIQQIVIDREGEFATLREKYPYLLVGREGEVAADIRSAKLLARKLLELQLSAVIDLSEMGIVQQREYVQAFVDALNHHPRELWKDCLVIIDEAHIFAPEIGRASGKEIQTMIETIATLLSAGRKRGYCTVLATQRLAKINKDVANECLNKLIGRTSNDDIKRAREELMLGKLEGMELRSLEPGTFWTYGPAIGIDPVLVRTGKIQTHPPLRGAARAPAPAAPSVIKKFQSELADLPKEAAEEARSIQDLQRKNADLERRIRQAEKNGTTKEVVRTVVDQAAISRAVNAAIVKQRRQLQMPLARIQRLITPLATLPTAVGELAAILNDGQAFAASAGDVEAPRPITGERVQRVLQSRIPSAPSDSSLGKGEKTMLIAIAQYPDGALRDQLTVLTGYKRSTRDAYIQRLSQAGFAEVQGNSVRATDAGVDALGSDFEPLPTGDKLREYWLNRLPEGESKILQILLDTGGTVARDSLSEETGYKRSTRDAYLQRLQSRRLVEDAGRGEVRASANLVGAL